MSGLHDLTKGQVVLNGTPVTGPRPEIGMIFQDANLLPWRNLRQNIRFPFEIKNLDQKPYEARIQGLIDEVGLTGFENKFPRELSGGMQQRASIVRCLSFDPDVILMDEPFGALDAFTRDEMNLLIQKIWMETGKTIIFVTHNVTEAIFLADRVVVLTPRPGRLAHIFRSICRARERSSRPIHPSSSKSYSKSKTPSSAAPTCHAMGADHPALRCPRENSSWRVSCAKRSRRSGMRPAARARTSAIGNWSALTSTSIAKSWGEVAVIVVVAILVIGGLEAWVRIADIPSYTFPAPSEIGSALWNNFRDVYAHHLWVTLQVLFIGYGIGALIGIVLAAVVTQFPFIEKIITPYILLLVTTPMIALVPLLITQMGFGMTPRIIATALAAGPMVMINAATGFRRTDLAKIALARSYGASTFQIFTKVRFPLALPMIIVGLMVGAIFGMLTAVGAEIIGSSEGLGNRLAFFSSRIRMADFWAVIVILAVMGILIYVFFYWVGKRWASWQA